MKIRQSPRKRKRNQIKWNDGEKKYYENLKQQQRQQKQSPTLSRRHKYVDSQSEYTKWITNRQSQMHERWKIDETCECFWDTNKCPATELPLMAKYFRARVFHDVRQVEKSTNKMEEHYRRLKENHSLIITHLIVVQFLWKKSVWFLLFRSILPFHFMRISK